MTYRLRLWTIRPLAAMLLVLALLVGGAVDAAACEFEDASQGSTSIAMADEQADESPTRDDEPRHDGDSGCVHGHCHHGAHSLIARGDAAPAVAMSDARYPSAPKRLIAVAPDIPKQPPRL